ncbi:MAG: hypothetical protein IPL55_17405 [Saprospiraceae bacterium]|nr:hypothetical protein [Saprospiraceae bacterium]MBL0023828.1 hypothetical protein [Saprospiraceae bacterium]
MNSIKIGLFIVLNVTGQISLCQSPKLYNARGSVKDEVTLQPLIVVLVYAVNYENNAAITDDSGSYKHRIWIGWQVGVLLL